MVNSVTREREKIMNRPIPTIDFNTCPICGKKGMGMEKEGYITASAIDSDLFLAHFPCECLFCKAEKIWVEPFKTPAELDAIKSLVRKMLYDGHQFYYVQPTISCRPPAPRPPYFFRECPNCNKNNVTVLNDSGDYVEPDEDEPNVIVNVKCHNCGNVFGVYLDLHDEELEEKIIEGARKVVAEGINNYLVEYAKWEKGKGV